MFPEASRSPGPWHGVPQALLLGMLLTAASFSRIVGDMNSMEFQHRVIDSVLAGPFWGTTFGRNVIAYALTLLSLHGGFALCCLLLARASRVAWPSIAVSVRQWLLLWFLGGTAWLLVANAAMYPNSSLGAPYATAVRSEWGGITPLLLTTLVLGGAIGLVCACALGKRLRRPVIDRKFAIAVSVLIASGSLLMLLPTKVQSQPSRSRMPHVILVGIDSLRPDSVRPDMESVAAFLDESAQFTDAITPLARTFPAWVATLTGRHPHTTGAVMNLLPRDLIRTGETLPDTLRRAGYGTAYAIDESRFSNVDASYGFDTVIAPPMGATEFMLSRIIDTPLSNVVMNTWLGALLFPHLHANRGAAATYDPDVFVQRLDSELDFDRPMFVALHLTLAHWPFTWSDEPRAPRHLADQRARRYAQAVDRVDRQFRDVMGMLDRKGALENALIVVLSDHGEAVGRPSDSVIPEGQEVAIVDVGGAIYGHGSSLLSPPQYEIVLGLRSFGSVLPRFGTKSVTAPVSLEDIAPTVLELLGVVSRDPYDGRSLVALLNGSSAADEAFRDRVRFTETEFNPQGVFIGGEISESGIQKAALFYRVDPSTDRVELRREHLELVLSQRQYGAMLGEQLVAAFPVGTTGVHRLVTLDRRRGSPRLLTPERPESMDPQTRRLVRALNDRFGLEQSPAPGT